MSTGPSLEYKSKIIQTESPIDPNACKFAIDKIGDYEVTVVLTIDNHFVGITGVRNTKPVVKDYFDVDQFYKD